MGEKALIFKLIATSAISLLLSGCVPLLIAGGAGAAAGYYTGKHYNIDVESPIKVEKKE
jgi:hypothetical protein